MKTLNYSTLFLTLGLSLTTYAMPGFNYPAPKLGATAHAVSFYDQNSQGSGDELLESNVGILTTSAKLKVGDKLVDVPLNFIIAGQDDADGLADGVYIQAGNQNSVKIYVETNWFNVGPIELGGVKDITQISNDTFRLTGSGGAGYCEGKDPGVHEQFLNRTLDIKLSLQQDASASYLYKLVITYVGAHDHMTDCN